MGPPRSQVMSPVEESPLLWRTWCLPCLFWRMCFQDSLRSLFWLVHFLDVADVWIWYGFNRIFFSQVFQIAMGRRKAIWLWKFHLTQPMAEAVFFRQDGVERLVLRSLCQLVFGCYISIYIDKFWRCFSFGPQKSEEDFPIKKKKTVFFVANLGGLRCWTSLLVSLNRWGVGPYARDGWPSFSEHLRKWRFLVTFNSNMYKTTNHLIIIHIFV